MTAVFDDFGKEKAIKARLLIVQPIDNVPGRERVLSPKTFLQHFAGLIKTRSFHCPCLLIHQCSAVFRGNNFITEICPVAGGSRHPAAFQREAKKVRIESTTLDAVCPSQSSGGRFGKASG